MATNDFKIIRGSSIMAAGNATLTLTEGTDFDLESGIASTAWFCMISNSHFSGMGRTVGGGNQNTDDYTVRMTYSGDNIVFTREGTANDNRIDWQIIQYVGSASGANEIIVRQKGLITVTSGSVTNTDTISGISNVADCVPWITAQSGDDVSRNDSQGHLFKLSISGTTLTATRGEGTSEGYVSYAIIEFTGSNWSVQKHEFSCDTGTATLSPSVTLSRTFYHAQYTTTDNACGLDDASCQIRISTTTLTSDVATSTNLTNKINRVFVISNSDTTTDTMMKVQWLDNLLMDGSTEEEIQDTTITAVGSLDNTGIMSATNDCTGTGTAFPRGFINQYLNSTTVVRSRQSDNGQTQYMSIAIVEFPKSSSSSEHHDGTSSITETMQLSSSGDKTGTGTGDISTVIQQSNTGIKETTGASSNTTNMQMSSTGTRGATGASYIIESMHLSTTGTKTGYNTSEITLTIQTSAEGSKSEHHDGASSISLALGTAATGIKEGRSPPVETSIKIQTSKEGYKSGQDSISTTETITLSSQGKRNAEGTSLISVKHNLTNDAEKEGLGLTTQTITIRNSASGFAGISSYLGRLYQETVIFKVTYEETVLLEDYKEKVKQSVGYTADVIYNIFKNEEKVIFDITYEKEWIIYD